MRKVFCDYCDFEIPEYNDDYDLYPTNEIDTVEIVLKVNNCRSHVHHLCKLKLVEELIAKKLKEKS